MTKIYGESDDLVEIYKTRENEMVFIEEVDCYDSRLQLTFSDGTEIEAFYGKTIDGKSRGIWDISIKKPGTAASSLAICRSETEAPNSDIFCINADLVNIRQLDP